MCKLQTSKCFLHLSTHFQADPESKTSPSIRMVACCDLIGPRFPMQSIFTVFLTYCHSKPHVLNSPTRYDSIFKFWKIYKQSRLNIQINAQRKSKISESKLFKFFHAHILMKWFIFLWNISPCLMTWGYWCSSGLTDWSFIITNTCKSNQNHMT